jgi:hypothetical protein
VPAVKLGTAAPGAVVLSSTSTPAAVPTSTSGRPSAFTSATATQNALKMSKASKWLAGAKLGIVAPGTVVFSSTDTALGPPRPTTRSRRPSPFTSAADTDTGPVPVLKFTAAAKLGTTAPDGVVFSSTDTSPEP